ncbi:MAG: LysM peptidoglycan-binding domain-containing protein [Owenweeksia sp.]|nr:LysM peptidoglycan-binding domain-containing protein [Owenweeksia sp.]
MILALLLCVLTGWAQSDSTSLHEVQAGETKYGISRQYGISIERLEKFNPDIKAGLKRGMTLLIPPAANKETNSASPAAEPTDSGFVKHLVKAKETLYSLAKTYGTSIAEIKAHNPQLADGLKVGQSLKIPVKQKKRSLLPMNWQRTTISIK